MQQKTVFLSEREFPLIWPNFRGMGPVSSVRRIPVSIYIFCGQKGQISEVSLLKLPVGPRQINR